MSFFDNAKQIMIDNKEVASIELGNKTIYEKAEEENHNLKFVHCGVDFQTEFTAYQNSLGLKYSGVGVDYLGRTISNDYLYKVDYSWNGFEAEYSAEQIKTVRITYWNNNGYEVVVNSLNLDVGDEYIYLKMVDGSPILTKTPCE